VSAHRTPAPQGRRLRVVHVAPEFAPLAKVGGLADAVAGLARAQEPGCDVTVILPAYPETRERGVVIEESPLAPLVVRLGDRSARFRPGRADAGVPRRVFLLGASGWFDHPGIYADGPQGPDPGLRFGAFCRAVLDLLPRIDLCPDVLHVHDHPAAFVPTLLRRGRRDDGFYRRTAVVLTVHNAAHQGLYDPALLDRLAIDRAGFTPGGPLEFWGRYNALKAGVLDADAVTTVSPTYAREIQGPLGFGLEGVFRERPPEGIANGIDTEVWNPARDPHLASGYSAARPGPRAGNRDALVREFDLDPARAVVGMVTRLADQKGIDLLRAGADRLLERAVSLVVLGSGDAGHRDFLAGLAASHPRRVMFQPAFDEPLAHRILGGADLFLMPSRFEPCGLTQLMAMRYGAIPVARRTGGIGDSVRDTDGDDATGFLFDDYTPEAMLGAVDRALTALADPPRRDRLLARMMAQDASWTEPARRHAEVYARAREARRNPGPSRPV